MKITDENQVARLYRDATRILLVLVSKSFYRAAHRERRGVATKGSSVEFCGRISRMENSR
jgi:hypothetical protein